MIAILKLYAKFVRKFINKPKNIRKMSGVLNRGYEEFLESREKDAIEYDGKRYSIVKFKTITFKKGDNLYEYLESLLKNKLEESDIITVAESILGVTQGRAFPIEDIKPSRWAYFIYPWVSNVTYGTGIGMPETMECALREIGLKKMLKATLYGAMDRVIKRRGSFYRIAGPKVKSIDFKKNHPVEYQGSHNYIVLSPEDPYGFCRRMHEKTNHSTAVIDANNVSVDVLGLYPNTTETRKLLMKAMKGNPAGQDDERTPVIIIREIKA
ncbi:MAG: coenzyme F420-0:L-glutamate ligase [bacterium]